MSGSLYSKWSHFLYYTKIRLLNHGVGRVFVGGFRVDEQGSSYQFNHAISLIDDERWILYFFSSKTSY